MKRLYILLLHILWLIAGGGGIVGAVEYGKPYTPSNAAIIHSFGSSATVNSYGSSALSSSCSGISGSKSKGGMAQYPTSASSVPSSTFSTSTSSGAFSTAASKLSGGVTTMSEPEQTNTTGPQKAWGWGGGIEPPNKAPLGDGIAVLMIIALIYGLIKFCRRERTTV